ncbi:uncharacterized protein LOC120121548 [Hibiscus syriacus]|uniref:uncharacterized protein LOC120121548 n=1 Tax=Hibiscus syriacus TaxID=106335 RepID=UPI001920D143|nr:uncharacterized protein LOC120121548 [Hibiscus syriacus]
MIICFWNIRGFNNPLKQNKVLQRAAQNKVDILCLLETRVKLEKSKEIIETKLDNWNVISNYEFAINGRISVLWKKCLDIITLFISDQIITVKGKFLGNPVVISAVYGENDASTPEMKEFQDLTQDLDLHEHSFICPLLTWSNKQSGSYLARKLDRVVINPIWVLSLYNSHIEFVAPGVPDHCMALTWLSKETHINRPKPFKFFNFWTRHSRFFRIVEQSWQTPFHGNPMMILFLKLKHLKNLNKSCYSDISSRFFQKRLELEQQQILSLKGEDSFEKEQQIQNELFILEEAELLFLKQKTKQQWIKYGDKYFKIFHSAAAVKNKKETIRLLVDDQGNRLDSFDTMAAEVIQFFTNLIRTTDPRVKDIDQNLLKEILNYSLPGEFVSMLVQDVTTE